MIVRKESPWFPVPKKIFTDPRLSLAARGLAGTIALLTADGGEIDTAEIKTVSSQNEISLALRELFATGYISEVGDKNILHL